MRQEYTKEYLQTIADAYDSLGAITECRIFTSGFENSNYFIETAAGKYVIKIFEGAGISPETVAHEAAAMDASHAAGVKTPHVLQNTQKSLVTTAGSKLAIVMDYIDGENISGQHISDSLLEEVGEEMGRMDTALAVLSDASHTRQGYEFDLKNFLTLQKEIDLLPAELDRALFERMFESFARIEPAFKTLPAGLIHNDVVKHNLLVKNGTLKGIVDFSDMAFSPYAQNIAVTLSQVVFSDSWQPRQAGLLIRGYRKTHAFSDEEVSFLYDLTMARRAQLVLAFSKWNRELGVHVDRTEAIDRSYRFFQRLSDMGRDAFTECVKM